MAKKRTCFCCGKEYNYCLNCEEYRDLEPWHFMFDSENCMKIFDTLQKFSCGDISLDKCIKILDSCDLSEKDSFNENVQADIDKILSSKPSTSSPSLKNKKEGKKVSE